MRITFISDTHNKHRQLDLPDSDLLIHAGDISRRGKRDEIREFLAWFSQLPHPNKIFIAGNHDYFVEKEPHAFREMLSEEVIYLENESVEIKGLKIWGSPFSPTLHNMAFNADRGAEINHYWEMIPEGTDILVTHGPPYGILDRTFFGKRVGCEELSNAIEKIRPRYHIFGHIHEAYGEETKDGTTYLNVSSLNLMYKQVNDPVTVEI